MCDKWHLKLFLDGARLGCALTIPGADVTLADLAALTDVFTIGGTKNGALFGEAVVLNTPCPRFRWHMKQRGAVLAKGRLLGIQFEVRFEDGRYFQLGRQAVEQADGYGPHTPDIFMAGDLAGAVKEARAAAHTRGSNQ